MAGGAPKGSRNAAKNGAWRRAVETALKRYEDDIVKRGDALDKIAEKAIAMALAGDLEAMREIGNRLDGKPTEHKVIEKKGGNRLSYAQRLALEEAKARTAAAQGAASSSVGHTVQ